MSGTIHERDADPGPGAERRDLAGRLRAAKDEMARRITADFLDRHPEWVDDYGEAATRFGEEDVGYHLDFLAGAILSREPGPFEGYAAWASDILAIRGVDRGSFVENLEQIRAHVRSAFPEPDRATVDRFVAAGIQAVQDGRPSDDAAPLRPTSPLVRRYLDAVLASDRRGALEIANEALDAGKTVPGIYQDLVTPAQREIGRLWAATEISVAEEHLATAITQYVVAQLYPRLEVPAPHRGGLVVTGVEGELHQIGGHMVADLLEADGWDVRFLGSHLPSGEILDAVEVHEARVLAVSATILANVPTVDDLVAEARARFPDVRIIVGGRAFSGGSWEDMGADAVGTSLSDAVELARPASAA